MNENTNNKAFRPKCFWNKWNIEILLSWGLPAMCADVTLLEEQPMNLNHDEASHLPGPASKLVRYRCEG